MRYLIGRYKRYSMDYIIYNHDTRKTNIYSETELINIIKRGGLVQNVKLINDKIAIHQNVVRRCTEVKEKPCFTVIGVERENYTIISNCGKVSRCGEEQVVRMLRKYPFTNAMLEIVGKGTDKESLKVKPIGMTNFVVLEDTIEPLNYDIEDFEKWRKEYKKIDFGVHGDSASFDGGALTSPFGVEIRQKNDVVHEFIKCYKLVRCRLVKSKKYEYSKIYKKYSVIDGQVVGIGEPIGVHVVWNDNSEVFLLWKDKKMINALFKENENNDSMLALERLMTYNRDVPESYDSITVSNQINERLNKDKLEYLKVVVRTGAVGELVFDDKYLLNCGSIEPMSIKYKCYIAARDNRIIYKGEE